MHGNFWNNHAVGLISHGRGRRPRRPASPERPRARPPARGAPRTSRPTSRRIPAPRRGGTGAWRPRGVCGRGRRPRRPASPERPRARGMDVPMRAAWTSPCARRAEDVAPYQPAHPVPLCRETLCPPPGRCGHERTAARCAILFGLRGTDERGRVPVRGVHHGTAKRRKPKRPCV